ncbi:signal recognition particle receptor subunit beta-like [Ptiloglossa arizonensis]|uniref:signal recognition particle receptor subunit beta-like n=1 Tax=Ptiloglossa arizonensis TaxID=3350558 RepID=UPI003FA13D56
MHIMEKEIYLLRLTKTKQLETTDASSTNLFLGTQGEDFQFSNYRNIEFAGCSMLNKGSKSAADIEQLNNWLQKIA